MPERWRATVQAHGKPEAVTIDAEWFAEEARYRAVRIEVNGNGREVTGSLLRGLPVQLAFRFAARVLAMTEDGLTTEPPAWVTDRATRAEHEESEVLLWVARTYSIARAIQDPPLESVAATFDVSQSTATRMVARARSRGLLDA